MKIFVLVTTLAVAISVHAASSEDKYAEIYDQGRTLGQLCVKAINAKVRKDAVELDTYKKEITQWGESTSVTSLTKSQTSALEHKKFTPVIAPLMSFAEGFLHEMKQLDFDDLVHEADLSQDQIEHLQYIGESSAHILDIATWTKGIIALLNDDTFLAAVVNNQADITLEADIVLEEVLEEGSEPAPVA